MKTEKILEIARRHILCFDEGGFIDFELIAFAQAIIEAQLAEYDDKPVAWLTENGSIFRSHEIAATAQENGPYPLYPHPSRARKLTDAEIEKIHREFPSRIDLFARAIERKILEKKE